MKTCTKCDQVKNDDEFSWSIKGIKKHSSCNSCRVEERMDYYERNKDKELKYKYERQIVKREEARGFVFGYLNNCVCSGCGETDPLVLTFHHTDKKKMDISQMVNQGYSLVAIKNEIDKCVILCANCHMRVEKERRGTVYG
jgi:hypothetical protein